MVRIADEVTTAYDDPGSWSIWIYGEFGSGKTVLGAGFPDNLIIDTEKSRRSLLNHPELATVPLIPAVTFDKFKKIADGIILNQDEIFTSRKTVTIDTWSSLQMKELNDQMREVGKKAGRNPDLPSEAEFNINNTRLRKILVDLIDRTDKNLVILSHIKEEKDDDGNTVLIRPGNSPSLSSTVAGLVDGIFYLSSKTDSKGVTTRTLKCMPSPKIRAKNRFAATLEKEIIDPTWKDIQGAIDAQIEFVKANIQQ